eukprot:jgi/Chlat1/4050/Chrsp26S04102
MLARLASRLRLHQAWGKQQQLQLGVRCLSLLSPGESEELLVAGDTNNALRNSFPSRRSNIPSFIVMDVMRDAIRMDEHVAKHGGDAVIHMEVGQPSTGAPQKVIEAARQALGKHRLGYTDALGLPELRENIARSYNTYYGVHIDPADIIVTTGSSGAFVVAFIAMFDAGARVALAAPSYPCYRNILQALGCEVVPLPVDVSTRYQPTVDMLKRAELERGRIDGLIIASPSNPTGTILEAHELQLLCDHCSAHGIQLISDEIYHGIHFNQPATTALRFSKDAVVMNSFSKFYSMTGWRVGWMVVPRKELHKPLTALLQNFTVCAPTLCQHAAVAAFDCQEELLPHVQRYKRNAEILMNELPKAGFKGLCAPDGAFYLYADISDTTSDSLQFCKQLLQQTGVATTPGIDFDIDRGHKFMRFSYCGLEADMVEATRRLINWKARIALCLLAWFGAPACFGKLWYRKFITSGIE